MTVRHRTRPVHKSAVVPAVLWPLSRNLRANCLSADEIETLSGGRGAGGDRSSLRTPRRPGGERTHADRIREKNTAEIIDDETIVIITTTDTDDYAAAIGTTQSLRRSFIDRYCIAAVCKVKRNRRRRCRRTRPAIREILARSAARICGKQAPRTATPSSTCCCCLQPHHTRHVRVPFAVTVFPNGGRCVYSVRYFFFFRYFRPTTWGPSASATSLRPV